MKSVIPEWLLPRLKFKAPKEEDAAAFPPLEKVCYKDHPCEDCGKILDEQRIIEIKKIMRPFYHWQYHCKSCNKYQDPETGVYKFTNQQVRASFAASKKKSAK